MTLKSITIISIYYTNLNIILWKILTDLLLQDYLLRRFVADCWCNVQLLLRLILIQLPAKIVILNVGWQTSVKIAVSGSGIAVNYAGLHVN